MTLEKKLAEITLGDLIDLLASMKNNQDTPQAPEMKPTHKRKPRRPVNQYDLSGKYINTYPSMISAGKAVGVQYGNLIRKACMGEISQAHGFRWEFTTGERVPLGELKHRGHKGFAVDQYDSTGKYILTYESQTKASEATGCDQADISKCCKGKLKMVKGFIWTYAGEKPNLSQRKFIKQYNQNGRLIAKYDSTFDAATATGCPQTAISKCCTGKSRTAGGYRWEYAE